MSELGTETAAGPDTPAGAGEEWRAGLRRLHWCGRSVCFGWWRLFFVEFGDLGNRRRLGHRDIFGWRRWLIFRWQRGFHGCGWNLRQIKHGRLVFNRGDADRSEMQKHCAAKRAPELPARWWFIEKWSNRHLYGPLAGPGMFFRASLLISNATL